MLKVFQISSFQFSLHSDPFGQLCNEIYKSLSIYTEEFMIEYLLKEDELKKYKEFELARDKSDESYYESDSYQQWRDYTKELLHKYYPSKRTIKIEAVRESTNEEMTGMSDSVNSFFFNTDSNCYELESVSQNVTEKPERIVKSTSGKERVIPAKTIYNIEFTFRLII